MNALLAFARAIGETGWAMPRSKQTKTVNLHALEEFLVYTGEYQKELTAVFAPDSAAFSARAERLLKLALAASEDLNVAIGELRTIVNDPTATWDLNVCTPEGVAIADLEKREAVLGEGRPESEFKQAVEPGELEDPFNPGEVPTYDLSNCAATWQFLAMETGQPRDVAVATILAAVSHLAEEGRTKSEDDERVDSLRQLWRVARNFCDYIPTELERSKGADRFAALLLNSKEKGSSPADLAWLAWNAVEHYLPGLLTGKPREATERAFADKLTRMGGSTFNSDDEWSMAAVRAVLRILGDPKAADAFKHRPKPKTKASRNK